MKSEEYSQYAFSALRALEGHIKYLLTSAGLKVGKNFDMFNKDGSGAYKLARNIADVSKRLQIEECYNYYKSQRDTIFHYGEILGDTDSTRMIETKGEVNEIIQKCIALICKQ